MSVTSDSVQSHRWQPNRLLCPWDSPGKNTGVRCQFLLQFIRWGSCNLVWLQLHLPHVSLSFFGLLANASHWDLWHLYSLSTIHGSFKDLRGSYRQFCSSFIGNSLISRIFFFLLQFLAILAVLSSILLHLSPVNCGFMFEFYNWILTHCFCMAWGVPSVEKLY